MTNLISNNVVLQVVDLSKRYGSLTAVDNLSLDIYEGEVFGFLGPNGAGKTTSINMMCGLLKPDTGYVTIRGVPISKSCDDIRAKVGVCPQNIVLWERLTCQEQLQFIGEMYGLSTREAHLRSELLLVDLDLSDKRNKQAKTLSGGMQRRLNLAMALVHDPEIVILDEPEAGLDPQSRVKVREYIHSLAHKKTVILTTHNIDEAERLADRVAIIDHGKLLVLDTPLRLKQHVGEGDVVEIGLTDAIKVNQMESIHMALASVTNYISLNSDQSLLTIHVLNAVSVLPFILETLKTQNIQISEIRLRENTLEDVFIKLTGRRLRE